MQLHSSLPHEKGPACASIRPCLPLITLTQLLRKQIPELPAQPLDLLAGGPLPVPPHRRGQGPLSIPALPPCSAPLSCLPVQPTGPTPPFCISVRPCPAPWCWHTELAHYMEWAGGQQGVQAHHWEWVWPCSPRQPEAAVPCAPQRHAPAQPSLQRVAASVQGGPCLRPISPALSRFLAAARAHFLH